MCWAIRDKWSHYLWKGISLDPELWRVCSYLKVHHIPMVINSGFWIKGWHTSLTWNLTNKIINLKVLQLQITFRNHKCNDIFFFQKWTETTLGTQLKGRVVPAFSMIQMFNQPPLIMIFALYFLRNELSSVEHLTKQDSRVEVHSMHNWSCFPSTTQNSNQFYIPNPSLFVSRFHKTSNQSKKTCSTV